MNGTSDSLCERVSVGAPFRFLPLFFWGALIMLIIRTFFTLVRCCLFLTYLFGEGISRFTTFYPSQKSISLVDLKVVQHQKLMGYFKTSVRNAEVVSGLDHPHVSKWGGGYFVGCRRLHPLEISRLIPTTPVFPILHNRFWYGYGLVLFLFRAMFAFSFASICIYFGMFVSQLMPRPKKPPFAINPRDFHILWVSLFSPFIFSFSCFVFIFLVEKHPS
jgi:hypothetical protein